MLPRRPPARIRPEQPRLPRRRADLAHHRLLVADLVVELTGTVVIRNPSAVDGGTAFRPMTGKLYFTDILK